jgi:methionyl-tRNA formyltransferase
MDRPKLRVGYILDDGDQSNAAFELFEKSRRSDLYSIELLIVQRPAKGPRQNAIGRTLGYVKKRGVAKTLAKISFAVIARIEKILFARNARYAPYFRRHALAKFATETLVVEPRVSKSGFVYRYSDADLDEIKKRNLDVLIRGGSGILRGGILTVCRLGIVSFHHANNMVNRGSPPGFWETYNREPSTGFIIQRLSEELDGGDVLYRGAIATSPTYVVNAARLYLKANDFMHALLERIAKRGALPVCETKQPYSYPLYTTPGVGAQINYLLKIFGRMGAKVWRKLRGHRYRWGVAYLFTDAWQDAVLWRSKVIKNPPHKFLADPFVASRDGQHIVFVEEYDFRSERGLIGLRRQQERRDCSGHSARRAIPSLLPFSVRAERDAVYVSRHA